MSVAILDTADEKKNSLINGYFKNLFAKALNIGSLVATSLRVTGTSNLDGDVKAGGNLGVHLDLTVGGDLKVGTDMEVVGTGVFDGDIDVAGSVLSTGVGNIGSIGAPWGTGYISSLGDSTHPVNELYLFGDTPSTALTQYYTDTPVSGNITGPVASTPYTYQVEKVGRNTTLTCETFSVAGNNGSSVMFLPSLPSAYLPNIPVSSAIYNNSLIIQDATGTNYTGSVAITDAGVIVVNSGRTALLGNFQSTLGANIGFFGFSVSYQSAT
jgi:hypothetical protein